MAPFVERRGAAKGGGAGTTFGSNEVSSGSSRERGSIRVRTISAGGEDVPCKDRWWSSIQRASIASAVSWIHWSIRTAISCLRFATWFNRASSKLCKEAREAVWKYLIGGANRDVVIAEAPIPRLSRRGLPVLVLVNSTNVS